MRWQCAIVRCIVAAWLPSVLAWDTTQFEYEPGTGRLMRKVYADGKAINYTYHYGDLPKRITQASGKWMERFYDNRLNVTSNVYSSENTPDVHIVPNEFGTPLRVADTAGLVYEYGICPKGQLLTNETVTSPWMDWSLGHSHDQFSRETGWFLSVDGDEKGSAVCSYDRNGRVSQMECVNACGRAFTVNYTNASGYSYGYSIVGPTGQNFRQEVVRDPYRRELVTRQRNTAAGSVVFDHVYSYDAHGRLVQRADQLNASTDRYSYYRSGELAAADISGTVYGAGYDSIGNCRWTSVGVTTNYYLYNELNQCLAQVRTGTNSREYVFDDDGNLAQVAGNEVYGWDCENRLIAVETPQGSVTNVYDYEGRLVRQHLPDAVRCSVFDRWNLIYEKFVTDDNVVVEKQYFWGPDRSGTFDKACGVGGLIAVSINGAFYFPCYGSNSEITAYVSESGAVVASYTYSPFGEVDLLSGPMVDQFSFRFMTKRYDETIGLYDFGARWYSPTLRRWLNRDPLGEDGGLNLYVFCENDPVNKYDPNGCIPLDTIWDLANIVYDICVGDDVALAADTAALLIPYVPAGTTKLVKAARLSNVRKVCPAAKTLEVSYKYVHVDYHFTRGPKAAARYVDYTIDKAKSYWKPGTTDSTVKGYIDAALQKAKAEGKIKRLRA